MDIREDRLEEIETGFWERGPLPGRDIKWLIAEIKRLRTKINTLVDGLEEGSHKECLQEIERLRAVPGAIAQRCEQYAGPRSDSLSGGAFREAARIARELGQNG
jgi:hypothetical protein